MKIISVDNCKGCPFCQKVPDGFGMSWVCGHKDFKGGVGNKKRDGNPIGRLRKDGGMPRTAGHRVTAGCPLQEITVKNKTF